MAFFSSTPDMQQFLRQQPQGGYQPNTMQKPQGGYGFGAFPQDANAAMGAQPTAPGYPPGYNASNAPDFLRQQGLQQSNPYMPQGQGGPFYQGPTSATAGELAGNFMNQVQPSSMQQYGYGNRPGQGGGYYEQQTPMGSFAAANQVYSQGAQPAQQQYGMAALASNPFIGQTSQGVGQQQSVMPYAQQVANAAQQTNPYLGQQSQQAQQVGQNAYAGSNPYLQQSIDAASSDVTRGFNNTVRPALDSAMRASGSFGNTAIQEQQNNAYQDLAKQLGNLSSGMRMQDYTQQQGLAENALNRQQSTNQFNATLGANDLGRNTSGFFTGQGLGLQGLNSLLNAGQFDATLGNNVNQFNSTLQQGDLNRNANLAQGLGTFNAGQLGGMSQFNAGQGNQLGQFNAQLGQNNNQFNAAQGNSLNTFNAGQGNAMLSQQRNLNQNADQFNQNMDFNTWQANNQNMRNGSLDQMNFLGQLLGLQGQGVAAGTQVQNTPLNYWQQFLQGATQAGGSGGTASQNLQGNPYLGALAGWNLFNGFGGGK